VAEVQEPVELFVAADQFAWLDRRAESKRVLRRHYGDTAACTTAAPYRVTAAAIPCRLNAIVRMEANAHAKAASSRRVAGTIGRAGQPERGKKREAPTSIPRARKTEVGGRAVGLCGCGLGVVSEVEVREVGLPAVGSEFDGGLQWLVEHECVAVKGREAGGKHGSEELPDRGA